MVGESSVCEANPMMGGDINVQPRRSQQGGGGPRPAGRLDRRRAVKAEEVRQHHRALTASLKPENEHRAG